MPQLSIDLEPDALQRRRVPLTGRARKFAETNFRDGQRIVFESRRALGYELSLTREGELLLLDGDLIEHLRPNDRVLVVINPRGRNDFQWFDAGALIVEVILGEADAQFLQSLPFELPGHIDSEVRELHASKAEAFDWRDIAASLLAHMVEKQVLGVPALLGFADYVRRKEVDSVVYSDEFSRDVRGMPHVPLSGLIIGHEPLNEVVLSALDRKARRALADLIDEANELVGYATQPLAINLDALAVAVSSGRAISLRVQRPGVR